MHGRTAALGLVMLCLALVTPALARADVAFTSAPYPLPPADSEYHSRLGTVPLVDLNNDSRSDIVIYRGGGNLGKVLVLLNKGDGTFAPVQEYPGCANPDGGTMETGQFNAGQAADVILGCEAGTGYDLLLGNGDGTLGAATSYSGIGLNYAMALWPSDNGGFPNLLYSQSAGESYLCYRPVDDLASPQCPPDTSASDAQGPSGHASIGPALATAHFYDNATCSRDNVIVSPYLTAVRAWGLNPFGTPDVPACTSFAYTERAVQGVPAGETLEYIAATDISGDGNPDLLMATNGTRLGQTTSSSLVALIWQAGSATLDGGFPPGQQSVVTPSIEHVEDEQVADFDGDGIPDAAVVGEASGVTTATLAIHRGHGDGSFDHPPVTFAVPGGSPDGFNTIGPNHLAAGDLNGDGRPDLVSIAQGGDAVTVLLNGSVAPSAPPVTPPVTPPVVADTLAPVISGLALTKNVFRVGPAPTAIAAAAPRGTTIRYGLSEAAKVTIAIARKVAGRRRGRRCVAPGPKLRRAKRCTRYRGEGRLVRASGPGAVSIAFSGRVGRRALAVGRHRMTLSATDGAGNASKRSTLSFRIVRR